MLLLVLDFCEDLLFASHSELSAVTCGSLAAWPRSHASVVVCA